MKKYNRVLTIAGSDSGGGAGIQADIKTISACGCYAASAITAVTVQNTLGVSAVSPLPIEIIRGQIDAVLDDIGADTVKIGMLHSGEVVKCVADALRQQQVKHIVLDPVMVSTSGHRLIEESAVETLKRVLIPMVQVITPNIPEAEILLGRPIEHQSDLPRIAAELAENFGVSVLLKAGHLEDDELVDVFYDVRTGEATPLKSKRIYTRNTHGTGCTLSSALAAMLARGLSPVEAARAAKEYINGAIVAGADYEIGDGHGPVHHFFHCWE